MKVVTTVCVVSWLILSFAFAPQGPVFAEMQDEKEGKTSIGHIQKDGIPGKVPMRIEEPDGTLRPLPLATMPESRMSTEGLEEIPDAGGGTMVNVEGRFQSILQVPEGSDNATHGHTSPDLQPLKP